MVNRPPYASNTPYRTPESVQRTLRSVIAQATASADFKKTLSDLGLEPSPGGKTLLPRAKPIERLAIHAPERLKIHHVVPAFDHALVPALTDAVFDHIDRV